MPTELIDYVGYIGAALVLFAFYRTSIGRWNGRSFWYELDNLIGAICLSVFAIVTKSYPTLILNVVWALAAFRGLSSLAERKKVRLATRARRC